MNFKKYSKKMIAALVIIMGISTFASIAPSSTAQAATISTSSLTTKYNSYSKQVTTLSNQVSTVKTRTAAWNLLYKIERLEDQIDYLEELAEYRGNRSLAQKCDRLEDKLNLAKDRLEYRWGIDD